MVFPWVTLSHFSGLLDMFKLICVSTKIILIKSFVNFHNSKSGVSSAYADKVHAVLCNTHTHTRSQTNGTFFALISSTNPAVLCRKQLDLFGINWSTQSTISGSPLYCSSRNTICYFIAFLFQAPHLDFLHANCYIWFTWVDL